MKTIGDRAFWCCFELKEITIPESVITIGANAFGECESLTSISLPESVETIGEYAFNSCGLSSITFTSSNLTVGDFAFSNITATAYVPAELVTLYKSLLNSYTDITIAFLNDYERSTISGSFGTLCLPYDYTANGATLYGIKSVGTNTVVLEEVADNKGLANTAYIYQATDDAQQFHYGDDKSLVETKDVTTGALYSPATYSAVPAGSYVLQTQNGIQAFYKVMHDDEIYIKPYRAYLTSTGSMNEPALRFAFDEGNSTGIDNIIHQLASCTPKIYDLNGHSLNTLQKGINIVNGVKVIVK